MSQRKYGAIMSYLSIFINLSIGLLFTPFLVNRLGNEEYGLYNIVGAFVAYLSIMDMGLNSGAVRFVAKYRTLDDKKSEENFLATISLIYFFISIIVIIIGSTICYKLNFIFGESLNSQQFASARIMLVILMANVAITIMLNGFSATLIAYERFVFLRTLEIISNLLMTLAICIGLLMGYKAIMVVVIMAGSNLFFLFLRVWYACSRLKVRARLHRFEWDEISDILRYSMPIFLVVIVEQVYWKLDNIILGVMLGPGIVALYAIGMSFHKYFMSFSNAISKVMLPKIVGYVEQGADGKKLTDLLISVSRIQAIVLMLVLSGLILFGNEFITLWIGEGYRDSYYVMLVTLIPYSLDLIGSIRNGIMEAKRIYWYRSISVLILSLINIPATIILVKMYGMVGAAASTGGGIFLGYIVVNIILKRKVDIDIIRYNRELSSGILPAVLLSIVAGIFIMQFSQHSWIALAGKVSSYTAVYILCMWYLGFNESEKSLIRGLNPFMKPYLKSIKW